MPRLIQAHYPACVGLTNQKQMQFDYAHSFALSRDAFHAPDFYAECIHVALFPPPKLPFFAPQPAGVFHYHAILNHPCDAFFLSQRNQFKNLDHLHQIIVVSLFHLPSSFCSRSFCVANA